jgi:transcriptional regulator with XRE-family HTH domain
MNYNKIKDLCAQQGLSIPQLAEHIGASKGLYTSLKNETISVKTLEKIAEALNVSVYYFFEEGAEKVHMPYKLLESIVQSAKDASHMLKNESLEFSELQNTIAKAIIAHLNTIVSLSQQDRMVFDKLNENINFKELDSLLKLSLTLSDNMKVVRDELILLNLKLSSLLNTLTSHLPSRLQKTLFD